MDGEVEGDSDLIRYILKGRGNRRPFGCPHLEQFELLRRYMRYQLVSAGSEIMDGVVEISPYRLGAFAPAALFL